MAEQGQASAVADPIAGSPVYPAGSRIDGRGRLEVGGCDVLDLAAEFGTPAYVYAEDDMRARARATVAAFAERTDSFEVVYASKAFPCSAALKLFAEEGLSCDVASGGELYLALRAGFDPERSTCTATTRPRPSSRWRSRAGVGHVVVDSFDEIDRLGRLDGGRGQGVLIRVTPGIRPDTHERSPRARRTRSSGSRWPSSRRPSTAAAAAGLELHGLHAHIGSQVFDLEVYDTLGEVMSAAGRYPVVNMGGGFAVAYTRDQRPPAPAAYAEAMLARLPAGSRSSASRAAPWSPTPG